MLWSLNWCHSVTLDMALAIMAPITGVLRKLCRAYSVHLFMLSNSHVQVQEYSIWLINALTVGCYSDFVFISCWNHPRRIQIPVFYFWISHVIAIDPKTHILASVFVLDLVIFFCYCTIPPEAFLELLLLTFRFCVDNVELTQWQSLFSSRNTFEAKYWRSERFDWYMYNISLQWSSMWLSDISVRYHVTLRWSMALSCHTKVGYGAIMSH